MAAPGQYAFREGGSGQARLLQGKTILLDPHLNAVRGFEPNAALTLLEYLDIEILHGAVADPSEPVFWFMETQATWSKFEANAQYATAHGTPLPRTLAAACRGQTLTGTAEHSDRARAFIEELRRGRGMSPAAYNTIQGLPSVSPYCLLYNPTAGVYEVLHRSGNNLFLVHCTPLDFAGLVMYEDFAPLITGQSRVLRDRALNAMQWEVVDGAYVVKEVDTEQMDRDLAIAFALAEMEASQVRTRQAAIGTYIQAANPQHQVQGFGVPAHLGGPEVPQAPKQKKPSQWKKLKNKLTGKHSSKNDDSATGSAPSRDFSAVSFPQTAPHVTSGPAVHASAPSITPISHSDSMSADTSAYGPAIIDMTPQRLDGSNPQPSNVFSELDGLDFSSAASGSHAQQQHAN
ncbi:hypothetical protein RI367_003027 [Sorochytrium milnesiophthora]